MKNFLIIALPMIVLMSLTQCNNMSPDKVCDDKAMRGKVISALVNNDVYMKEVMDSMQVKHADAMLTSTINHAQGDNMMQSKMMDNMMEMCKKDTNMCKMMMGKTMEMCDKDAAKCKMMMGSMQPHSNVMKSMEGMCDMKGMKGMKMDPQKK